jgi:hypothetical protein
MKNTNLNTGTGSNNNILDKMYDQLVRENLETINEETEIRLETYDLILYELKREEDYKTYEEIKYRITDGEPPNEVFYDIILRGDYSSALIWLFKRRIEEFIEEDTYSRFYK